MTKKVILPTDMMVFMDKDAPSRMMAIFKTLLDANFRAGLIHVGWKKLLMIVPINRAMMDAPSSSPGISPSMKTEIPATAKHIATPSRNAPFFFAFVP